MPSETTIDVLYAGGIDRDSKCYAVGAYVMTRAMITNDGLHVGHAIAAAAQGIAPGGVCCGAMESKDDSWLFLYTIYSDASIMGAMFLMASGNPTVPKFIILAKHREAIEELIPGFRQVDSYDPAFPEINKGSCFSPIDSYAISEVYRMLAKTYGQAKADEIKRKYGAKPCGERVNEDPSDEEVWEVLEKMFPDMGKTSH